MSCKLVLMRKMTGMLHPIEIFVDGEIQGMLNRDTPTISVELVTGPHTIHAKGGGLKKTQELQFKEDSKETFLVYFSSMGILGGGLKFKPYSVPGS